MKKRPQVFYPVFLNIWGTRCVVIGGGGVALRKVKTLLEYGADVDVISPLICSELQQLAEKGEICIIQRHYQKGDLKKARLVIAATDDQKVNIQVSEEARSNNVLVNVADNPDYSDFIVPSTLHRGDMRIAISTGGKSPALSRKIRTRLEQEYDEEYSNLVALIEELRLEARQRHIPISGETWQKALDIDAVVSLLKQGQREKAKSTLMKNLGIPAD